MPAFPTHAHSLFFFVLLPFFLEMHTQGLLLPFASRVAEWEVDDCEGPKMVFRRNSLASKLTTACLHLLANTISLSYRLSS